MSICCGGGKNKLSLGDLLYQTQFNVVVSEPILCFPIKALILWAVLLLYIAAGSPLYLQAWSGGHSDWSYSGAISCLTISEKWGPVLCCGEKIIPSHPQIGGSATEK